MTHIELLHTQHDLLFNYNDIKCSQYSYYKEQAS